VLKVAHIVEAFGGGVLTYLRTVLPRLASAGCNVTLVCSLDREWPGSAAAVAELEASGVVVIVVPMARNTRPLANAAALFRLRRILRDGAYDLVHTHASIGGALGRVAARMAGVRAVFHTPHCFAFLRCDGRARRHLYLCCERLLGKLTTGIVAVSREEADAAVSRRIVPAHKCRRLDNVLDDKPAVCGDLAAGERAAIKSAFGIPPEKMVVAALCRLVEYKGVFRFLESAGLSRAENALFLVAGDGPLMSAAKRWIARRDMRRRILMLGHVPNTDDLYRVSDVVVSCSRAEGMPYVLLEAMRARRAVVATEVPGNRSVIRDGMTGRLVPPDPRCIAGAVDQLLADARLRERYGDNARAYFLDNHLPDNYAAALLGLYGE